VAEIADQEIQGEWEGMENPTSNTCKKNGPLSPRKQQGKEEKVVSLVAKHEERHIKMKWEGGENPRGTGEGGTKP